MEIVIVPTPADGGRIVADIVARAPAGPGPVNLGLATGSSPLLAYAELGTARQACRSPVPRPTCSTSTWGWRPITPSPTGR